MTRLRTRSPARTSGACRSCSRSAFMVVIGSISAAVLSSVASGLNARSTLDQARNREYAADGLVDYAIAASSRTGRDLGSGFAALCSHVPQLRVVHRLWRPILMDDWKRAVGSAPERRGHSRRVHARAGTDSCGLSPAQRHLQCVSGYGRSLWQRVDRRARRSTSPTRHRTRQSFSLGASTDDGSRLTPCSPATQPRQRGLHVDRGDHHSRAAVHAHCRHQRRARHGHEQLGIDERTRGRVERRAAACRVSDAATPKRRAASTPRTLGSTATRTWGYPSRVQLPVVPTVACCSTSSGATGRRLRSATSTP